MPLPAVPLPMAGPCGAGGAVLFEALLLPTPMPKVATGGLSGVTDPVPPAKAAVPFAGTSTPAG